MLKNTLSTWNIKRLRLVLFLFFIALTIPTAILIKQAYSQLKWEAFHHYRLQAEELVARIDRRYHEMIEVESARAFTDYSFLNIAGDVQSNFLQRSPLASFPVKATVPGTIGYFQVDNNGQFTTPLLPSSLTTESTDNNDYGINIKEKIKRQKVHNQVYQVLNQNRLVDRPRIQVTEQESTTEFVEEAITSTSEELQMPSSVTKSLAQPSIEAGKLDLNDEISAQAAFDQLKSQKRYTAAAPQAYSQGLGRIEDLKLKKKYPQKTLAEKKSAETSAEKREKQKPNLRKERNVLPSSQTINNRQAFSANKDMGLRLNMFESEIDAFEFSMLESGHFVLYRKVWRDGKRYIQGLLIDPKKFIDGIIRKVFYETIVSNASNLAIAYQGNVLSALSSKSSRRLYSSAQELQGTLLLQNRLSTTLDQIELIFSVNSLPAGPGGAVITWLSIILFLLVL